MMQSYNFINCTRLVVCFFVLLSSHLPAYTQDFVIKGKVADEGTALPEVKVYLKGYEDKSATTQADGTFTLTLPAKVKAQNTLKGTLVMPSGIRHAWSFANEDNKFFNIDIKDSKDKLRKKIKDTEKEAQALDKNSGAKPIKDSVNASKENKSASIDALPVTKENATTQKENSKIEALERKEISNLFSQIQKNYQHIFTPADKNLAIEDDVQKIIFRLQQEQELTLQRNQTIRQEIQRITQKLQANPTLPDVEKGKIRGRILELEIQLQANIEAYEKLRQVTERELAILKRLANIQESFLQRNKSLFWIFGAITLLLLSSSIFYFFISRQRLKQRNNLTILVKQIEQQQEELKATNEELNKQTAIIAEQKKDLDESVDAALLIQTAMLPAKPDFDTVFGKDNYFLLYKPHGKKVSGDFYFMEEKRILGENEKYHNCVFFICADCTGHGIPGALMTMLGGELLHDIIQNRKIHEPAKILRRLHMEIRRTLHYETSKIYNGMDLSLIVLHRALQETKKQQLAISKIEFAGAKNNLYYILDEPEYILHELKGDRKGVGGQELYENEGIREFQTHTLTFEKSQMITLYLCSDGFQDQLGGAKSKPLGSKKMREVLQKNCQEPMQVQSQILEQIQTKWKEEGQEIQTDDITVIGLKIQITNNISI